MEQKKSSKVLPPHHSPYILPYLRRLSRMPALDTFADLSDRYCKVEILFSQPLVIGFAFCRFSLF